MQELLKTTAEIKEQVRLNTLLLHQVVKRQKGTDKVGQLQSVTCLLPLKTYDSVESIEQKLKSKEFYSQMVLYFSLIGGATIKYFVSRTMNKLLHPDFAKRFVWAGRLTKKHAFKRLELRSVLFEATCKNPVTSSATMADVDEAIKLWLRGAPDRHGGRVERAKKTKVRHMQSRSRSRSRSHSLHNRNSQDRHDRTEALSPLGAKSSRHRSHEHSLLSSRNSEIGDRSPHNNSSSRSAGSSCRRSREHSLPRWSQDQDSYTDDSASIDGSSSTKRSDGSSHQSRQHSSRGRRVDFSPERSLSV